MSTSLQEFLQRKGAVGLLSLLHERPMSFSEIEPEINVTSSTIIERRDEAAEIGLVDISLGEGEVGTRRVYHLTAMGEYLTEEMARRGIVRNYRKMRTLQQQIDEATDELVVWIAENRGDILTFEEAKEGTIIDEDYAPLYGDVPTGEMDSDIDLSEDDFVRTHTGEDTHTDDEGEAQESDEESTGWSNPVADNHPDNVEIPDPEETKQGSLSNIPLDEPESDADEESESE